MLFWTRRTYCFLLCLSSNLAGVLPFRNRALGGVSAAESPTVLDGKASIPHPSISLQLFAFSWFEGAERPIYAIVQARLRHVCGLRAGALFFFLGGSKGAVLDPPNVLFFLLCLSSNLAGVLPFRNRALGGVSAAESPTVLDGKASIPHPSISLQLFAISWFEGAERPPVLKPMRHRLGMNLAGVRNRALGGVSAAASPTVLDGKASIPHPSISLQLFAFSWFEGAERPPVLKPIRRPLGMNLAVVLPFRIRAVGRVSAAESPTVLDGKASTPYPIHPSLSNSLLLAGSKVLKGPRSSNPLGAPWA